MTLFSFAAGANDCWADQYGSFNNSGGFLWIGGTNSIDGQPVTWIPFTVTIAKGVGILSATLKVIATSDLSTDVYFQLGCEAADSPAAPTDQADLWARNMTAAKLNVTAAAYVTGTTYSYDITTSVQEVLARAGWASGNTLAALAWTNGTPGSNRRAIASANNGTYGGAVLEIDANLFVPRVGGVI